MQGSNLTATTDLPQEPVSMADETISEDFIDTKHSRTYAFAQLHGEESLQTYAPHESPDDPDLRADEGGCKALRHAA